MRTFDVYSKRDHGGPILNNASLMLGNGATVVFENGQSTTPVDEETARLLARNPTLSLVPVGVAEDLLDLDAPAAAPAAGDVPGEDVASLRAQLAAAEQRAAAAEQVAAEREDALRAQGAQTTTGPGNGTGGPQEPPADPEATDLTAEQQQRLDDARAHLAAEGEDVPDPEPVAKKDDGIQVPEGFDTKTNEGRPRCLAAKGDGSQCANEAKTGHACGLAKHQEQVAALPRVSA